MTLRPRLYQVTLRRLSLEQQAAAAAFTLTHTPTPTPTPSAAATSLHHEKDAHTQDPDGGRPGVHLKAAGGGGRENGSLSIAQQGVRLCEAATALHEVAIWYAHRAEQLEGLLVLTPKNSPTKISQIGLLSASCHAPSPLHYAPAEAMTATTDTRSNYGTSIQCASYQGVSSQDLSPRLAKHLGAQAVLVRNTESPPAASQSLAAQMQVCLSSSLGICWLCAPTRRARALSWACCHEVLRARK